MPIPDNHLLEPSIFKILEGCKGFLEAVAARVDDEDRDMYSSAHLEQLLRIKTNVTYLARDLEHLRNETR